MAATEKGVRAGRPGLVGVDLSKARAVLYLSGVAVDALDDCAQIVALKVLEQPRGSIRDMGAWIAVVAGRVAVDWHRARQRGSRLTGVLARRVTDAVPGLDADDALLALTVSTCLEELSPEQRVVLVLRFYADLTVPQIADRLGIPEGTVKSRLHFAVAAMRQQLAASGVSRP